MKIKFFLGLGDLEILKITAHTGKIIIKIINKFKEYRVLFYLIGCTNILKYFLTLKLFTCLIFNIIEIYF